MKKIVLLAAGLVFCSGLFAMTAPVDSVASAGFSRKYDLLVSRLGPAGVGVETVLDNWAKVDPENKKLVLARYSYYLTKSQTTVIVEKPGRKYLGKGPVLTLKDSAGADVNYFEEVVYDDSLYSLAIKQMDKAVELFPKDMDVSFMKAAVLVSYEKESPDIALDFLYDLIERYYASSSDDWVFDGQALDEEFFEGAIQEYCYTFYNIGSSASYSAFRSLSEKMLSYDPKATAFIANIGSYYLVAEEDSKKALKYYNKVLKINPDDYTAIKNCVLLCRRQKNTKGELKYLPMLIRVTPDEAERMSAQVRLDAMTDKK